jgi:hypothetical protein
LISYAICFLLVRVMGLADFQFRLNMATDCSISNPLLSLPKQMDRIEWI